MPVVQRMRTLNRYAKPKTLIGWPCLSTVMFIASCHGLRNSAGEYQGPPTTNVATAAMRTESQLMSVVTILSPIVL